MESKLGILVIKEGNKWKPLHLQLSSQLTKL